MKPIDLFIVVIGAIIGWHLGALLWDMLVQAFWEDEE